MKTKWHLFVWWSVFSPGLLGYAADTYESPLTGRRKKIFTLGAEKSEPTTLAEPGDGKSSQRPAGASPPPHRPYPAATPRPARRAKIQGDFAPLPDVSVTCSTSDLVVRVKPSFYGLGADAEELTLGRGCKSNGVLRPYGDFLFTYPLIACDAEREVPRGYVVYKFVLHYEPSPKRFPSRAHRIDVDVECRYQRNHHVYQLAVKPTWKTAVVRKRLGGRPGEFQIQLMDDSWHRPARSQVYQLGQTVNLQVSALHLPSGGKLYISSCYATPSSGSESSLKYTIIGNFGCMLDSKRDPGASQFLYRTDKTLQFSLRAFQFTADPDAEVSIHCKLSVTSEEPSPAHKSCTYTGNEWKALTGDNTICKCCDTQCVTSKSRRAMMEGSASSVSLLVSDQPYPAEDGFLLVGPSLASMSTEGKTTVGHHMDELHSHGNLWESGDAVKYDEDEDEEEEDEDEEEEAGHMEEELEEDGHMEEEFEEDGVENRVNLAEEKDLNEFGVDGSGYDIKESESEEEDGDKKSEERENEIFDTYQVKIGEPKNMQPHDSEGEDRNRMYTERGEDVRTATYDGGLVDDREMTWYFTWR